jgi:hypothetical protein
MGPNRNAASGKQIAFIAGLAARLGVEPEKPATARTPP